VLAGQAHNGDRQSYIRSVIYSVGLMEEDGNINELDTLLSRMPEIAKAVSAFPEAVQQSAFDALIASATGTPSAAAGAVADPAARRPRKASATSAKRKRTTGAEGEPKTRRAVSSQPKVVKELDLRPKGKKSLSDFAAEKNPTSNHDRTIVALYYLANVAEISPVNRDQVFTCYREMGWKIPPDFANSLQQTATKKRYLDTSDAEDLRVLNPGLNRVEHDLPLKKA
jgi:hypothetical protein